MAALIAVLRGDSPKQPVLDDREHSLLRGLAARIIQQADECDIHERDQEFTRRLATAYLDIGIVGLMHLARLREHDQYDRVSD
jgi:hypothetical protein